LFPNFGPEIPGGKSKHGLQDMVFLEKSVEKLGHKLEKWAGA